MENPCRHISMYKTLPSYLTDITTIRTAIISMRVNTCIFQLVNPPNIRTYRKITRNDKLTELREEIIVSK